MLQESLLHVMLMLINIYEDNSLLAQAELIHTLLLRPNIPVIIVTRLATTTVHVTPHKMRKAFLGPLQNTLSNAQLNTLEI